MIAIIYTKKKIADKETALKFLNSMKSAGFTPDKIGSFEPIKTLFNEEEYINMWTDRRPGCFEEGVGMIGEAGGILTKTKKPRFMMDMSWWDCPDESNLNVVTFFFTKKTFKSHRSEIEKLFKESIEIVNGVYGFITESTVMDRQHVTGTLKTRLPGVFWCNYFSESFIDFFGKEKINEFPWWKIERGYNNGLCLYLKESPLVELIKDTSYERRAKDYLGRGSFGDEDEYLENSDVLQVKNVPPM